MECYAAIGNYIFKYILKAMENVCGMRLIFKSYKIEYKLRSVFCEDTKRNRMVRRWKRVRIERKALK